MRWELAIILAAIAASLGGNVANSCNKAGRILSVVCAYAMVNGGLVVNEVPVTAIFTMHGHVGLARELWTGGALAADHEWAQFSLDSGADIQVDFTASQYLRELGVPHQGDLSAILVLQAVTRTYFIADQAFSKTKNILAWFKSKSLNKEASMVTAVFKQMNMVK